jgi:hypothetical protein
MYSLPVVIATQNLHIGIVSILVQIAWSRVDESSISNAVSGRTSLYESPTSAAIRAAVECDNLEILTILFLYAPRNLQVPGYISPTAFTEAFRNGNIAIAEFISSLGFDLSESTSEDEQYPTSLGLAVHGEKLPMIRFLPGRKVNQSTSGQSRTISFTLISIFSPSAGTSPLSIWPSS